MSPLMSQTIKLCTMPQTKRALIYQFPAEQGLVLAVLAN